MEFTKDAQTLGASLVNSTIPTDFLVDAGAADFKTKNLFSLSCWEAKSQAFKIIYSWSVIVSMKLARVIAKTITYNLLPFVASCSVANDST